jgi:hypothetical protein
VFMVRGGDKDKELGDAEPQPVTVTQG